MATHLRSTKLYTHVTRHQIVHQFVKYALIGVLNVGVHLAIFNLLSFAGLHVLAANAVAFFVATVNSFFLNKNWTFRDPRRSSITRRYFVFLFFTVVGLGLHTAAFRLWLVPLGDYGRLGQNVALLGALPVSVIWNFTSYRLWTFAPGSPRAQAPDPATGPKTT